MSRKNPSFTPGNPDPKVLRYIENAAIQATQEARAKRRAAAAARRKASTKKEAA